MKIGFLTSDWALHYKDGFGRPTPGGAGYYRMALPCSALEKYGNHEVFIGGYGAVHKKTGEIFIKDWHGTFYGGFDFILMPNLIENTNISN